MLRKLPKKRAKKGFRIEGEGKLPIEEKNPSP